MKNLTTITLLILTLNGFGQDVDKLIDERQVEQTIRVLSADDMKGRGNFTPGIEKAARFIESEFKSIGLKPMAGNADYRQHFSMIRSMPTSVAVTVDGEVVDPAHRIIVSGETFNWTNNSGVKVIHLGPGKVFVEEYLALLRAGKDVVVLVDTQYANFFKHFAKTVEGGSFTMKKSVPSAQVFLLGNFGAIKSFSIAYQAVIQEQSLFNLVGVLPGKQIPDQYVLFSGHFDHLGIVKPVDGDSVANGADDDGSGITGVITLARYFKKINNNSRSLLFVAFTAEEIGEYGSQYFATQLDPDKVAGMLNMELIGLASKFGENAAFITGYDRSNLGQILQRNIAGTTFTFHPDPYPKFDLFYRSDNASLARLGVPAHTISTAPIDTDKYYHTVKDEFSTLDIHNMTSVIRAIALGSRSIVSGQDTPSRVEKE